MKIRFANKAYLRLIDKEEKDVVSQHCYGLTHGRKSICRPPNDTCPIMDLEENSEPKIEIHEHPKPDGSAQRVFVSAAKFKDCGNYHYLHIATPITCSEDHQEKECEVIKERLADLLRVLILLEPEASEE
jgi:hypothetical protein